MLSKLVSPFSSISVFYVIFVYQEQGLVFPLSHSQFQVFDFSAKTGVDLSVFATDLGIRVYKKQTPLEIKAIWRSNYDQWYSLYLPNYSVFDLQNLDNILH